jgi:hypothetical protein
MGLLENGYVAFQDEALTIAENYSKLAFEIPESGVPCVKGNLDLVDEYGSILDTYGIRIDASEHYPKRFPFLFETEGRIPKNYDWHVFENDGHCCICTIPNELLKCKKGINLLHFIENEVKPYLYNQTHRRLRGYFLNETAHGEAGEFQEYYTLFKTKDLKRIIDYLLFISQKKVPGRTHICFCGSKEKYRHCHRDAYNTFSILDEGDLFLLAKRIMDSQSFKNLL